MDMEEGGTEGEQETNPVGKACTQEGGECGANGTCVDQAYLMTLGIDTTLIQVPNGMCSGFCAGDEQCGPGARCFNTQPFSGSPVSICLALCDDLIDCRWEEGYSCFSPLTEEESAEPASAPVCLPDHLVVAIHCGLAPDDDDCPQEESTNAQ